MVRDSEKSVAMAYTTLLSEPALSGERQREVGCNGIDHFFYQRRPLVVRDSEKSVAMA